MDRQRAVVSAAHHEGASDCEVRREDEHSAAVSGQGNISGEGVGCYDGNEVEECLLLGLAALPDEEVGEEDELLEVVVD